MSEFVVSNLNSTRDGNRIISGVNFCVAPGEVHVLVGKNGAGKSTLLNTLMGHPSYTMDSGRVTVDGCDVTSLATHERARKGLFLSLQQPPEVPGVPMDDFLRTAIAAIRGVRPNTAEFEEELAASLGLLRLDPKFAKRSLNEGFSGGEKKRSELLQMLMLKPKYALLDEPDSGLDTEAVEYLLAAIQHLRQAGTGFLIVTHYPALVEKLKPTTVHTLENGTLA